MSADSAVKLAGSVAALRGVYFRDLLGKRWVLALIGFGALAVGLVFGITVAPLLGPTAAAVVVLFGVALPFVLARRRASRHFFAAFASERELELVEEGLPEVTPLLCAGTSRLTNLAIEGELAPGLTGTIAHYTYALSMGKGSTSYELTIVLLEVPGVADVFPEILCHGRVGEQRRAALDGTSPGHRTKLVLESAPLDRRFEIFYGHNQDEVRLRRLFSPSFMVWLTESMPSAFELVNGNLCCFAGDHLESAADLDHLVAGAVELARRIQAEAAE
jgi:hypothetical protein